MTEREISHVIGYHEAGKTGKYVVKLAFPDEKAQEYWMTPKQLDNLLWAFEKTPKGYSTAKIKIIGVFNERGYYAWCKTEYTPWEPPIQYDLSFLEDK